MLLVSFIAWSALSAIWAESTAAAYRSTIRFAPQRGAVPHRVLGGPRAPALVWVLAVFVAGAQLSVLWGFPWARALGDDAGRRASGRLTGARADSNVLATMLLVATLFAAALAVALRPSRSPRRVAFAASLFGLIALFATFSRGGVVALIVVVLAGMVYGGRWGRAMAGLGVPAVLVGAALRRRRRGGGGGATRLMSSSSSGRSSIWTVGWRMVEANPVIGVGSGNYTVAEPHYLLTAPGLIQDQFILDTPYVAHNIYLHILAEMGVIGLVLFLGLLGLSIASAVRAVRIAGSATTLLEVLGRALVIALAGILAADFFVSEQYSKQLWLLLALCPALLSIARRESPARRPPAPPAARGPSRAALP